MGLKQDRELMHDLCEIEEGLTDWEVEFIESVAAQVFDLEQSLTPDQLETALELHDRFYPQP